MSVASRLALAVFERVQGITIANGFQTDIGLKVFRGKKTADYKEVPFAFVVEGDDQILEQSGLKTRTAIPFVIEGHMACDPENPNDAVHLIVADLKRAIFGGDATYGGLVRGKHNSPSLAYNGRIIGEREDGAAIVGAAIMFAAEIAEDLANP